MTAEQFTYWLQGFIEVENPKTLNLRQTKIIKDHLNLVFKKETPNYDVISPPPHQHFPIYDNNRTIC